MNRSRLCQLAWQELYAMSAAQGRIDELQNCLTVQPSFSCQEKKLCVMASQLPGTPPIHHIPKYSSQLLGTPPIHHIPKYCLQLLGTISIHHIKNKFKKKQQRPFKKKKSFLIYLECTERITWVCFSLNSDIFIHSRF